MNKAEATIGVIGDNVGRSSTENSAGNDPSLVRD